MAVTVSLNDYRQYLFNLVDTIAKNKPLGDKTTSSSCLTA